MLKLIALLLVALILFPAVSASSEQILTPPEPRPGGDWTCSHDPTVTGELRALFEKGMEPFTGIHYDPVVYLGSQDDAGTSHAFLCRNEAACPGRAETFSSYWVIFLHEDLSGSISFLTIAPFDFGPLSVH